MHKTEVKNNLGMDLNECPNHHKRMEFIPINKHLMKHVFNQIEFEHTCGNCPNSNKKRLCKQ